MQLTQDLLTQMISGFEVGFVFWLSLSFVMFVARRNAISASEPVPDLESPSLPELFAIADALSIEKPSELPRSGIVENHTLQPEPASLVKEMTSQPTIESQTKQTIRYLKQLAKDAKIPNYGRMTKPQLLAALALQPT